MTAWDVIYYRSPQGSIPAIDFLEKCPTSLEAKLDAILDDVAQGPPLKYRGGGYWEAMHGAMTGWYEVRADGPGREHFRLYCLLENGDDQELSRRGLARPAIAVIDGRRKSFMTTLDEADYAEVRALGQDHLAQYPRRIAEPDPIERTVVDVRVSRTQVIVTTADYVEHVTPIFGRLVGANRVARDTWCLSGDGRMIYWPIINEQCAVESLLVAVHR